MIYKRPGKSKYYWTRFEFGGREVRQSTKCTNKKKAGDFEANLKVQLQYGRIGIDQLGNKAESPLVFTDAMADFLDNLETKESTQRRCKVASHALIAFFGKAIVSSIDSSDVERFRGHRKNQHKKPPARLLKKNPKAKSKPKVIMPATVNRELALLKSLFTWLIRKGKVAKNPVTGVSFLREKTDQWRVVTDNEFRKYLFACGQPLRDVAALIYETGLRPGEVFNLKKAEIDLQNRTFIVSAGKTEAARRRLRMSPEAERILGSRFANASGDLLFPGGRRGNKETPIVKLTNGHLAAVEASGVKSFRLYDLRHTYATHLGQSGCDLVTMTAIMGWSRIEMAKRYVHPTEQHKADAIVKLENFRNTQSNVRSFQKTA